MRLVLLLFLAVWSVDAQVCAPGRMLPVGAITGSLDDASCFLSDSTAYASYRLDLPARGSVRLTLSTAQDFVLILRDSSGVKIESGQSIRRALEAGAYTVLVNARVPGQVGAYSVRSEFTGEAGVLCEAFPSLGLSQRVDGALDASGCVLPDGSPYDAYFVTTFGAGTLTVHVGADWPSAIFIRTPDGAAIAAGESSVTTVLDRDTQYLVVVSTAERAGPYQVVTAFEPAENETCRAVKSLAAADNDTAAITPESCTATLPGSGDLLYYNFYAITVGAAGVADFRASSTEFAPTLHLFDESGNAIASDAGGSETAAAQIRMQLRPGRYVAQVVSPTPAGGAYRFAYGLTERAPRPCAAAALDLAAANSAPLSEASCRTELGLSGLYTVSLPASGTLDLTVTPSPTMSAIVAVRDAKDNLVVASRDVQGLGVARLTADLPAGAYTVLAAANAGAGFYQLTGSFTERQMPACPAPQALDINGGYIQRLGSASCRAASGGPVDYYEFTLPAAAVTAMIMTSSDLDGHLTLTDSAGAVLRSDDNSYGFADPLMVQHLPAGTYRLAARSASGTLGGRYQVDVRTALGPRPPFCSARATVPVGGTVTGTINFAGCQFGDHTFADLYKIELAEAATLDIRLTSAAFDAYLLLLDAKGNLVDRDDDGGGNRDARIVPSLAPGAYYVVAKPVADYTAAGAYTLSVQ